MDNPQHDLHQQRSVRATEMSPHVVKSTFFDLGHLEVKSFTPAPSEWFLQS